LPQPGKGVAVGPFADDDEILASVGVEVDIQDADIRCSKFQEPVLAKAVSGEPCFAIGGG
jgi:hypothetical protein